MSIYKKPKTINPDEIDPSVYYYDEVYDDMKDQECSHGGKHDGSTAKKQGSKYIQGIIETADRRKSEKEIRKFRKYARDRQEAEARGELETTDVYVSQSYERKLKEVEEVLKKNSQDDQILEYNALKKQNRSDDCEPTLHSQFEGPSMISGGNANVELVDDIASDDHHTVGRKKRPKTLEERREYLRDILKKQTVGEAFEAALQRYKQRKALAL